MQTTLGIDLASQPVNTAVCIVAWGDGAAEVRALARSAWDGAPLDDALLSAAVHGEVPSGGGAPAMVGIDAPFGWPDPFVRALTAHHALEPWTGSPDATRAFTLRETDRVVHAQTGKTPLSVSADRIAYPAMRCAALLGELSRRRSAAAAARDGSGLVAETYPDAALRAWLPGLWPGGRVDGYKRAGDTAHARRRVILAALREGLGERFALEDAAADACVDSDDCLDALVCALVARAVARGLTRAPEPGRQHELARREGWIHLPRAGTLAALL